MICAWQEYLNLLPLWLREPVDRLGRDKLEEIRLRCGSAPELVMQNESHWLERKTVKEDLQFCVNIASRYSPWAAQTTGFGYITAAGGHRIGLCGDAVVSNGIMTGYQSIQSVCIRVSRDFPGIAAKAQTQQGSLLIIGRPGSGKTTLLRDLIRQWSDHKNGCVAVVDERREIFPNRFGVSCYLTGARTDVLSGCSKKQGIEAVLRSMNPSVIAVDEITAKEDCDALLHAGWCGVNLLATAHAGSRSDLMNRPVYRPIIESKLFDSLLILRPDKSWHMERM